MSGGECRCFLVGGRWTLDVTCLVFRQSLSLRRCVVAFDVVTVSCLVARARPVVVVVVVARRRPYLCCCFRVVSYHGGRLAMLWRLLVVVLDEGLKTCGLKTCGCESGAVRVSEHATHQNIVDTKRAGATS